MNDILILILRRLRMPIVTLVAVYAIAIFGLVLMPGTDPDGKPWHMSVFDAFYVMSYTATTIGFGEVPYPYSYAQRLWMTVSIYLTVIGWAYTLGSVFALARHPAFRIALGRHRFQARVRRMTDPFFVVCGYGQSGRRLVTALDEIGFGTVVLEPDPDRARAHLVRDTRQPSALLVADARSPEALDLAGLRMPNCAGLVALAGDDEVNQSIAISARVISRETQVLARVKSAGARETLEAVGDVFVVDPFETFAVNFGMALRQPDMLRLEEWLSGVPGADPPPRIEAPRGHWVIAGYGRFGRSVARVLEAAGLSYRAIDLDAAHCGEDGILGSGLAKEAMVEAGIGEACGIVAATDVDANNLAIVNNARRLKPDLFVVVRQNLAGNRSLIEAARADMEFVQSVVMSNEIVQLLTTPLLNRFLMLARSRDDAWSVGVAARIRDRVGEEVPHSWTIDCDPSLLGARRAFQERPDPPLRLAHLLRDPDDPTRALNAMPLLLVSAGRDVLLPEEQTTLHAGDRILFAGEAGVEGLQRRTLGDDGAVDYLRTGIEPPRTWLGRLLAGRQGQGVAAAQAPGPGS
ncbi:MAG: NAD-binding protein [Burkholderiales bacterium]|nr:NAD-binding protein [Burkholderiales bacterium]